MPISLAAAQVQGFNVGGAQVETADSAACANLSTDFGGTIQIQVAQGTPASNGFSGSARAQNIVATLNLASGAWTASNGTSGTLSGAALASFKTNTLVPLRNQIETFLKNNVFPGSSQVNWT